ncbi:hypothetical protein ACFY00_30005 [Kitasatospora sp. NPDC001540]|uniref:hypothetical protein n=1 Tax=Kitasatospora sp. NPDC001540 TaxID=3364014 RepID=UPI00367AA775
MSAHTLPRHYYDPARGLNVTAGGTPLVEAMPNDVLVGFTITNRPPPIGSKKDDD